MQIINFGKLIHGSIATTMSFFDQKRINFFFLNQKFT